MNNVSQREESPYERFVRSPNVLERYAKDIEKHGHPIDSGLPALLRVVANEIRTITTHGGDECEAPTPPKFDWANAVNVLTNASQFLNGLKSEGRKFTDWEEEVTHKVSKLLAQCTQNK